MITQKRKLEAIFEIMDAYFGDEPEKEGDAEIQRGIGIMLNKREEYKRQGIVAETILKSIGILAEYITDPTMEPPHIGYLYRVIMANNGSICPRCIRPMSTKVENYGISRRDNKTRICHKCCTEEALIDGKLNQPTEDERSFIAYLQTV